MTTTNERAETFRCASCGVEQAAWNRDPSGCGTSRYAIISEHGATGRAYVAKGLKADDRVCTTCADELERETLKDATAHCGYVSCDGKEWTTWTGGKLGRVVLTGKRHPWSRERYYVTVRDVHGAWWHGTAGKGMWASLRRTKGGK